MFRSHSGNFRPYEPHGEHRASTKYNVAICQYGRNCMGRRRSRSETKRPLHFWSEWYVESKFRMALTSRGSLRTPGMLLTQGSRILGRRGAHCDVGGYNISHLCVSSSLALLRKKQLTPRGTAAAHQSFSSRVERTFNVFCVYVCLPELNKVLPTCQRLERAWGWKRWMPPEVFWQAFVRVP